MADGIYNLATMNCSNTDRLLPLSEEKLGEYLNDSIDFYRTIPTLQNASDAILVGKMCTSCQHMLKFTDIQLLRVVITWTLFVISAVGNIFVLCCVCRRARASHVHMIMMHFAIADLTFTFLVLPKDAMWNTTMEWLGGEFLCRLCQMGTHIAMYISSFMVVVMALDRCFGLLRPMSTNAEQRKRTKYFVGGAWILSIICAIPPAVIFSVAERTYCPQRPAFLQCIDNAWIEKGALRPYFFFTMAMSFLLPMIICFVSYVLVVCEITSMMNRDRVIMGRRDSAVNITRARKKIIKLTALVTLSFVLFWGPYYGYGVYSWFNEKHRLPPWASLTLFVLMYVHPAIHPFIYGVLMKDVRDAFKTLAVHVEKIITCNAADVDEMRRARNGKDSSIDNMLTTTTSCRRSRPGNGVSSSDASPFHSELAHLRHNGDSTSLNCRDGSSSCMTSSDRRLNIMANGNLRTTNDFGCTSAHPEENNMSRRRRNIDSKERDEEKDRLLSNANAGPANEPVLTEMRENGTTRPSQVSFKLPVIELKSNGNTVVGINNNNEQQEEEDNGDSNDYVCKSSSV